MMKLKLPVRLAVGAYLCGGKEGTAREIWEALGSEGSFKAFSVQLAREEETGFLQARDGQANVYSLTPDGEQASIALIRHFQKLTGAEFPMRDPKPPTQVSTEVLKALREKAEAEASGRRSHSAPVVERLKDLEAQLPKAPPSRLSENSDPPRYQSHPIPGFVPAWKKNKVQE